MPEPTPKRFLQWSQTLFLTSETPSRPEPLRAAKSPQGFQSLLLFCYFFGV